MIRSVCPWPEPLKRVFTKPKEDSDADTPCEPHMVLSEDGFRVLPEGVGVKEEEIPSPTTTLKAGDGLDYKQAY
ncbi:hypothetical protein I4U23_011162 [Adineta vaga]|nr:hypothetical protein I4U23_011162 [Adineta vaga]